MSDCLAIQRLLRGYVKQTSSTRGVLFESRNLIVDISVELIVQSLIGGDQFDAILFGFSGGIAATPGVRAVTNPIYRASIGKNSEVPPFISEDNLGYKSILTCTGIYANPGPSSVSYDMLGLVSQNDRLFAAKSFPTVTVAANESISVEWTILTLAH